MTHQMKFVVKPPSSTTTKTGRPCQRLGVPWRSVISLMGSPAARPKAKQALITPEMLRRDSRFQIEFLDGGALLLFGHFAFLGDTCRARDEDAEEADANAMRIVKPERVPQTSVKIGRGNGRHQRTEGGGVAENHGHAERHAE